VKLHALQYVFAFAFGAAIGSFLNVLIYRLPRRISIIAPQSFCPNCKKPIRWYENVPILSYLFLRGKCARCQKVISLRYPVVEMLTSLLFIYTLSRYHLTLESIFIAFFFCAMIVVSFIDFSFQVIPDVISLPGIVLGILYQILAGGFIAGFIGMLFGGGLILLIRVIGGKVYKKEVMGMGDVYLTAMIGVFVGFPFIIPAIFIAALVGAVLGIIFIISTHQSRESPIPFGPFLAIGGATVIIFQPQITALFAFLGVYL
jgi:leader peptidase (prepilin peptidase)/N-methyltransferase